MDPSPIKGNGHAKTPTIATFLIDTNVLVYCYDRTDPTKQALALELLNKLKETQASFLSTQVLNEFFSSALRKLHMTPSAARTRLVHFINSWQVLTVTPTTILDATRGVVEYQLNFWDALLWATAVSNKVSYIFSEDFQDGIRIEGVRVVNPFKANFDIDRLFASIH